MSEEKKVPRWVTSWPEWFGLGLQDVEVVPASDYDALVEAGGWVKCSERLPEEHSGKILVTNNLEARDAFGHMSHIWLVQMIHDGGEEFGWFAFDDYDNRAPQNITHWMPLPPAPEPHTKEE